MVDVDGAAVSQAFIAFALAHGVEIKSLDDSGKIRRCPTVEHPRSTNGAYLWDGRGGFVWAWDGEGRAIRFEDPNAKPLSDAEQRQRAAKRKLLDDERDFLARSAAAKAAKLLTIAKPAQHGYLQRKGFKDALGLCLPDGELLIPMRHVRTNELLGAQIVKWLPEEMRWEKKYLYGQQSKGAVLRLGPRQARESILCEGYATGLSLEAAVRQMRMSATVLVTFSAHNLVYVAEHTTGDRFVIADNDPIQRDPVKALQNPGQQGERAARATGLRYAMPATEGQDANDCHVSDGLMAVAQLLMQARRAEVAMT